MKNKHSVSFNSNTDQPSETPIGKVWLLGAGSLDPSLISVRGRQLLDSCDVLVYDDLIHPDLIASAACPLKIYAGKRSGRHSMKQEELCRLLYELSLRHCRIVRLKGGDPFIFGRGMEELLYLENKGVETEVVPGIPSPLALSAFFRLPLTHRGAAGSVTFVTAHTRNGLPAEDWKTLAGLQGTIVFFMGLGQAELISHSLIRAGKDPQTPCAILSTPDLAHPEGICCTLRTLGEAAKQAAGPALIVIGETVRFFRKPEQAVELGFFGSRDFLERLQQQLPSTFQIHPLVREEYEDDPQALLASLEKFRPGWICLFSRHGAGLFLSALRSRHIDLRSLAGCRIAAIGKGTAQVLEEAGLYPDCISLQETSLDLAQSLTAQIRKDTESTAGPSAGLNDRVLLLRSAKADDLAETELKKAGLKTEQTAVYDIYWKEQPMPSESRIQGLICPSLSACRSAIERLTGNERTLFPQTYPVFVLSEKAAALFADLAGAQPVVVHTAQDQTIPEALAHTIQSFEFRKVLDFMRSDGSSA